MLFKSVPELSKTRTAASSIVHRYVDVAASVDRHAKCLRIIEASYTSYEYPLVISKTCVRKFPGVRLAEVAICVHCDAYRVIEMIVGRAKASIVSSKIP